MRQLLTLEALRQKHEYKIVETFRELIGGATEREDRNCSNGLRQHSKVSI
jgi:hypothetical protein